jgi:hypothetical protein
MKRRQLRWILGVAAAATGLGLMLVAPVVNALSADAATVSAPALPALGLFSAGHAQSNSLYSGYYENLVGADTLTSTFTVPTVKCTNKSTWGTDVGLLGLMNSSNGQIEHGGGVEVGCSTLTGTPTYAGALCDPNFSAGCGALADPVAPGDVVQVTVSAADGCAPTCASVSVAVTDSTADWTESWTGSSQSDFDTFVAVVGSPPVPAFGKVQVTGVTINGSGFDGQRFNLVDHSGRTLARASALSKGHTTFNVRWLAAS